MIGVLIGVCLVIMSFIINLTIPKKQFNEYPTDVIEEIPWREGGADDASPSSVPQYRGRVKYEIEGKELFYKESVGSSEPKFHEKISFKSPVNLKDKEKYIFVWSLKVIGIIVFIICGIIKLKE
jgi:hypothetical protein